VMLRALPKAEPDAAPRRIGFRLVAALDDEAAAEAGAGTGPDDAAPTP
ncbi:MAG: hypothetical protein H5U20_00895, partial [Rhodobacteraceae bacterium]|nr:hypothetical protein [Paracoccaceae bacterium]